MPASRPVSDQVYPRVCGGTWLDSFTPTAPRGLSPRVRGNPLRPAVRLPAPGSIPACAGEPAASSPTPCSSRVYPRVCGGTTRAAAAADPSSGLSPRVRGNPDDRGPDPIGRGSIPACAGEPIPPSSRPCSRGVYPRVCGGTTDTRRRGVQVQGLSPRVRGNPSQSRNTLSGFRSIPACAGEPRPCRRRAPGRRVYPRVCGGT